MSRFHSSFLLAGSCLLTVLAGVSPSVAETGNQAPGLSGASFSPNPAWTVEPAALPSGVVSVGNRPPCIASRVLPNGDEVRFSGGGSRLTGISVRSSGLVLTPESSLPTALYLDGAGDRITLSGYAPDAGSVIVNVMKYSDLYQVVQKSHLLTATVGEGASAPQISFSLTGVDAALRDLESCYAGRPSHMGVPKTAGAGASVKETSSPSSQGGPLKPVDDIPSFEVTDEPFLPSAAEKGVQTEPELPKRPEVKTPRTGVVGAPAPAPVAETTPAPLPITVVPVAPAVRPADTAVAEPGAAARAQVRTAPRVESFRARKGESLRDVVRRWADRSQIDLVWTSGDDVLLNNAFSFVGTLDEALKKLLADYPESGLTPTFRLDGGAFPAGPFVSDSAPPADTGFEATGGDLRSFVPSAEGAEGGGAAPVADAAVGPVAFGPVQRWRALQGASLREVLQAWCEDAKVTLIWETPHDYAVQNSITSNTDYAQAVTRLLDQYRAVSPRPVGQIYSGESAGEKILVIRPSSASSAPFGTN